MRYTRPFLLCVLSVVISRAEACTVPVFQYALENVEADHYRAVVFSHGLLAADAQQTVKSLQESKANLSVSVVNVDESASQDALKVWHANGSPALPWLAVSFPRNGTLAWSGTFDASALGVLLDSPARRQLHQQLLGGASVVWVLLESGDLSHDDKIAELLQNQSADLAKKLQLPVSPPQAGSDPLKLAFSVVRVARTAPEEKFFTAQLLQPELNPHPDNLEPAEPLVFPVFGRGKALPALKAKDLLPEKLAAAAQFLSGACSCEIKAMSPGVDLLISADWETEVMLKFQRTYSGTFAELSDSQKPNPEVVGSFETESSEKKPGQRYLLKVANGDKTVLETLKRLDGKKAQIMAKLQVAGTDVDDKYLVVSSAMERSSTPKVAERRKKGGI